MLVFKFAGALRRHFRQVALNVETPSQGLRLLLSQNPAFKRDFYRARLRIRVAGLDIKADEVDFHLNRKLQDGATVLFVPVVEGALGLTVAAWVVIGLTVAATAYSLYLTSTMKTKTSAESAQDNSITNNSFTSAENRVGQGRPVPLLLGEMVVGSNVISLGIDTSNNKDWVESIS